MLQRSQWHCASAAEEILLLLPPLQAPLPITGWLLIAACHVQRCGWECCHTPSCIAWCGTWCVWQALVLLNLDAKLHGQLLLKHLLCLC
jgi:hypothetical protein